MEYTNEFLARVYGAYIGCKVRDDLSNEFPKLMGFTQSPSSEKENGTNEDAGWVEVRFEGEWKNRGRGFNQVTLHLTPLSEISDEDAIEVAGLVGLHRDGCIVVRQEGLVLVDNDTYQLQISNKGYVCLRKDDRLYNMDMRRVYTCLMNKSYDCGYGEIPSLIEAGIAIKKQQP